MTTRILIVDDDRDHAESIADVLTMRGYEVEVAASGEQGAARFRDADFAMVLMDVKLPGMNGVETFLEFKRIRSDAKVMMMTGFSVEQLIAQAVEGGAIGVLRKPFAIDELLHALERVKPRGIVLVADDDPEFAESVRPILTGHGYRVEIARTGREALQKISAQDVNCLILDVRMPVLSGLEVYLQLKEAGRSIPTVFVTAFADGEYDAVARIRLFREGLLLKPFNPQCLLTELDRALARKAG